MHIPFTASNLDLSENKSVKVANPLNSEESLLRSNLLQSLISAVEDNLKRGFKTINLFEIGRSYKKSGISFSEEEISGWQIPPLLVMQPIIPNVSISLID